MMFASSIPRLLIALRALLNGVENPNFCAVNLGFIFQSFNLIPTLNVLENVLIPTIPDGQDDNKLDKAIGLIKEMGLGDRMKHKPMELSGGERQRVCIARSLINDPEIIYADEPTGNLDSVYGTNIINLIKRLRDEEKKTFVIVTHDPGLTKYADKIYSIKDGLIYDGLYKK